MPKKKCINKKVYLIIHEQEKEKEYLVDDFFSAKSLKKWYVTVEIKGRKNYVKTII